MTADALLLIRLIAGGLYMLAAARHDLKNRTVPPVLWAELAVVGLLAAAVQGAVLGVGFVGAALLTFGLFFLLGYGLFRIGFGGADAKAMWALGVLFPASLFPAAILLVAFAASIPVVGVLVLRAWAQEGVGAARKVKVPFVAVLAAGYFVAVWLRLGGVPKPWVALFG